MTSLRRKAALCAMALICLLSLGANVQGVRAYVFRMRIKIDDIAELESRVGDLSADFPTRGNVKYRSDREVDLYILQHALVPLSVSDAPDAEWLVMNFYDGGRSQPGGYHVVRVSSSGAVLLRRDQQ